MALTQLDALKDRSPCFTITYVEILVLKRAVVYSILERYPYQRAVVRKAEVRMAVKRAVITASKIITQCKVKKIDDAVRHSLLLVLLSILVFHRNRRPLFVQLLRSRDDVPLHGSLRSPSS